MITFEGNDITINTSLIIKYATIIKSLSFSLSFLLTIGFHYSESFEDELTKNEFMPSVTDAVGNFYPNRSIFKINIALLSSLIFVSTLINFFMIKFVNAVVGNLMLLVGLTRYIALIATACISLEDDAGTNVNCFSIYVFCTGAWIWLVTKYVNSKNQNINTLRSTLRNWYFFCIGAVVLFFYKHQAERSKYAYSLSSLFQWALILLDIYFDYTSYLEFKNLTLTVKFNREYQIDKRLHHSKV